jgi:Zn-dependent protease with chaperone function
MAFPAAAMRKAGDAIKPGFNLFSKEHDVQLGQQAAAQIGKQYHVVENRQLQDYVRQVGERLAAQKVAKDSGFPFTFKLVSDKSINAFALPGGPTFVHTGLIAAADNEAQLAGVLAHELSHVILRHGTNQASKANLLQLPAILAGAVTGSNLLAQLTSMGASGFLLKFSRTAETEADLLGARLMNDAGYNPVEMARFFEKLEAEGGSRAPQFLSDHPNPGNRVAAVQAEIRGLPQRQYGANVGDFAAMKSLVAKLPSPPAKPGAAPAAAAAPSAASRPSGGFKQFKGREVALSYPDNWQVFGESNAATVTIAPREGVVQTAGGGVNVGYGVIVSFHETQTRDLQQATDELVQVLRRRDPAMQIASDSRRSAQLEDSRGLVTMLASKSPYQGQYEQDMLLTVSRPVGLFYAIFIAPVTDFPSVQDTFNEMVRSIRFSN